MDQGNRMNILISTNSAYLTPTMVMLYSLFIHHSRIPMDIYLPYSDLTDEEVDELERYVALFREKKLYPLRISDTFSSKVSSNNGISIETYYRILAIELLPDTIHKILYLDVDMVIQGSLLELYEIDMTGHPFVVCEDILGILNDFHEMNKYRMHIPQEYSYFNAGVMLFNLAYLRETHAAERILERVYLDYARYEYNDQDVLNEMFYDQLLWAGWDQYNLPPALYYLDQEALAEQRLVFASYDALRNAAEDAGYFAKRYRDISYEMRDHAKIIHYMGAAKPWKREAAEAAIYRFYDEPYWRYYACARNRRGENGRIFHGKKTQVIKDLLSIGYSYYYLRNRMEKARHAGEGRAAWILGSSYAAQGIQDADKPWLINLSAPSQDLFCSNGILEKILTKQTSSTDKICVFVVGYYALYDDVSRAGTQMADIMRTVYEPLIGSMHHYEGESFDIRASIKEVYPCLDDERLKECEDWITQFMDENNYFNPLYTRETNDPDYQRPWTQLSETERISIGKERAGKHNRLMKHAVVKEENILILQAMMKRLSAAQIPVVLVIPPFTTYYREHLEPTYQTELLETLERMPVPIEYYDFNDTALFEDADFFDSDHLNDAGAAKFTAVLSQIIESTLESSL